MWRGRRWREKRKRASGKVHTTAAWTAGRQARRAVPVLGNKLDRSQSTRRPSSSSSSSHTLIRPRTSRSHHSRPFPFASPRAPRARYRAHRARRPRRAARARRPFGELTPHNARRASPSTHVYGPFPRGGTCVNPSSSATALAGSRHRVPIPSTPVEGHRPAAPAFVQSGPDSRGSTSTYCCPAAVPPHRLLRLLVSASIITYR